MFSVPIEHGLRRGIAGALASSILLKIGCCAYLEYAQVDTGLSQLI